MRTTAKAVGLVDKVIWLHEEQVIDGWHRYKLAHELGLEFETRHLPDGVDPRDFVLAKNDARRHRSAGQRAMAVALVMDWKVEPKKGRPAPSAPSADVQSLADVADVSKRTMEQARAIVQHGAPETIEAVVDGAVSVKNGADIALHVDKDEQPLVLIEKSAPSAAAKPKKPALSKDPDVAKLQRRIADLEALNARQAEEVAGHLERVEEITEQMAEVRQMAEEMRRELEAANKVLEAEDGAARIKAALAEASRWREAHATLEDRFNGLMSEKAEATKLAAYWQRQAKKGANGAARH